MVLLTNWGTLGSIADNLGCQLDTSGKEDLWARLWSIMFLSVNCWRRAQPTAGGTVLRQMLQGYIRKLAEQVSTALLLVTA